VLALTRQTALEWGPRGVRANAVSPGFMQTSMSVVDYADEQLAHARAGRVPVRRIATPDDVARAVAFLAGPDAGYVNGEELTVDGGLTQTLSETFPRPPA
jgi:NAD(P)-dependent dehydrogenase (short-subunit alcohol dehydrogenase family)